MNSKLRHFPFQRYFRRQRSHNFNTHTQTIENDYMKLNFPHTNESQYGNRSENQETLNKHINQIDRDIDVDLGVIKSNNQISASKI